MVSEVKNGLREGVIGGIVIGFGILPLLFASLWIGYVLLKWLSGVPN